MITEDQLLPLLKDQILAAGSLRSLAKEWGFTPSYLCDLVNGRRKFSDAILERMGLVKVVTVRYAAAEGAPKTRRTR